MNNEVYRSFEGKLNYDNQTGYIIYDDGNWWTLENLSVWRDINPIKTFYRIDKSVLSPAEFDNIEKIAKIEIDIDNGNFDSPNMQVNYHDKWYSCTTIRQIQNTYQDYEWRKYI